MAKPLTPHMKDVLMRMGEFQKPLVFWGWDRWSTDERPIVDHGESPRWYCAINTVRALEDRDLITQVDFRKGEKKDCRVLTERGQQEAKRLLQGKPTKLQPKASALALQDSGVAKSSISELQADSRLLRALLEVAESLSTVVQNHTTYTLKEGKSLQTWCGACGEMVSVGSERVQKIQYKPHGPSCSAQAAMRSYEQLLQKEGIKGNQP